MSQRVFVKPTTGLISGGLIQSRASGLGDVVDRIPVGFAGHLVKVRLDTGAEVTASSVEVFSPDNIVMFRRRHIPAPPFPGGSGAAA